MPLKTSFLRIRRFSGADVHIKAPIAMPGVTLCGLDAIPGKEPKKTNAPVSCPTCRAIADYCQSRRALRKIIKDRQ
jgi:hypothetical protein